MGVISSRKGQGYMDSEGIKKILPHREPMLLVDEADLQDGAVTGRYTVKGDEFFLKGHFPGNPVVPGVILCEMMAQTSCLLVEERGFTPYFTGMNDIRFKGKVLPGDTLVIKSELKTRKGAFYYFKCSGYVGDKLVLSGELSFAVVKEE
jgi:3-hydroxyacyl-[acyl-carrier-protein] dehydratase